MPEAEINHGFSAVATGAIFGAPHAVLLGQRLRLNSRLLKTGSVGAKSL
jgi:hypothetical protein